MSAEKKHYTEQEIIAQFRAAMEAACLRTAADILADGELHRFHVEGDSPSSANGFYVLYADGIPAGHFGSYKGGQKQNWCIREGGRIDPADYDAAMRKIAEGKAKRKELEGIKHEAAAQTAQEIWDRATECESHPYLERKRIASHGLRVGAWPYGGNALLIPLNNGAGRIITLQAIFANENPIIGRDKDFLKGGKKRGGYFSFGSTPTGAKKTILIGEGYATCATVHEGTGLYVRSAFDAGNMIEVAKITREQFPDAAIIMLADNDRWTFEPIENPGVIRAREAAAAVGGRTCIPEFEDLTGKPTDFNDLYLRSGIAEVKRQIEPHLPDAVEREIYDIEDTIDYFNFPHKTDRKALDTSVNMAYMFDKYGITCKYNEISKEREIDIPGRKFSKANKANADLATISDLCVRNNLPLARIQDHMLLIAEQNTVNPAQEWIASRKWDGQDRISKLAATLDSDDKILAEILVRRWMIGAIGCAFKPQGMSMQGMLVLQGEQNVGKTTWFWSLLGENRNLGKEGASLDPADRDSVKMAISHWLVELGELDATFNKSDIAALKQFITKDTDELFLRYSRTSSHYPRSTAFLGTVNPKQFLHDDTGNRRFWTIRCGAKMIALHGIDMQQAWAQAKHLYDNGEQHRLRPDELAMLNAYNDDHMSTDPIEELLRAKFAWGGATSQDMTASEALIAIGYDRPSNAQSKSAGKALRKITGEEPRRTNGKLIFSMPRLIAAKIYGNDNNPRDDGRPL